MVVVISQRPSGSSYVSSSPSFNSHTDEFFSLPASPTTGLTTVPLDSVKELEKNCEGCSDLDYFEFDISQNFQSSLEKSQEQQEEKPQQGQDSPLMSFADELFCDGHVLPLRLPPRLQYFECTKPSNQRSNAAALAKSQSLLSKGPFHRWSFRKNETYDFDPFKVALEHVRGETRGRDMESPHRRTRSLSPIRTTPDRTYCNDSPRRIQHENRPSSHQQHNLQNKLENDKPPKLTPTTLSGPTLKRNLSLDIKRSGSYLKEFRRLIIMGFLFRSASEGRADSKDKLRPHTAALRALPPLKCPSFHSIQETHNNPKKEVTDEESKKKIFHVPYKTPWVFSCFSFGRKYQMNN